MQFIKLDSEMFINLDTVETIEVSHVGSDVDLLQITHIGEERGKFSYQLDADQSARLLRYLQENSYAAT